MSSQAVIPNTEAAILARILVESDEAELNGDAARYLLSIKLPHEDEDRVNELSAKAQAGLLTQSERNELDSYLHVEACWP